MENPALPSSPSSKPLSQGYLQALYPAEQEFYLSTSGLTEFYRNQYSYFLLYVLGLQEELRLRPDARSHGNFLQLHFWTRLAVAWRRFLWQPSRTSYSRNQSGTRIWGYLSRKFRSPVYQGSSTWCSSHNWNIFSDTIQPSKPSKKKQILVEKSRLLFNWTMDAVSLYEERLTALTDWKLIGRLEW